MSITFSVAPKKDPRDKSAAPKYYAVAKSTGRADTNAFAWSSVCSRWCDRIAPEYVGKVQPSGAHFVRLALPD